jgi:hypothetical protein
MIVNQLISLQIADAHRQLNQTETVDSAECTSRIRPGAMQGQVVCYAKLSQARSPQQTVQVEGHTPSHCNVTVSTYTIHKLWSNCENIVIIYFLYVQLYYTYCNIQTYVLYIYIHIIALCTYQINSYQTPGAAPALCMSQSVTVSPIVLAKRRCLLVFSELSPFCTLEYLFL